MRYFVIPARGGSKIVPDKNVRDLGGRPLLAWTVAGAQAAAGDWPVVVNSDDKKILDIAEGLGARSYQRPAYLGGDETSMRDVVKDFFRAHDDAEDVVLLYPTCPFRAAASLRRAVQLFDFRGARSLMSVSPFNGRPYGGLLMVNGALDYAETAEAFYRKQDTPALYFANGSIYITTRDEAPALNTQLFNKDTLPFILDGFEQMDIDTEHDLAVCQAVVRAGLVPFPAFARVGAAP